MSDWQFRPAQATDIPCVADILGAAAAGLRERGHPLWSVAEVSEAAIADPVHRGLYHIGFEGAEPVGVFRLEPRDTLYWPEMADGTAMYLHKLAVAPRRQGQGIAHALLAHAVELTRSQARGFLRLDCAGGRPQLRAVYERFGFLHHSDKWLGDRLFHRFELPVALKHSSADAAGGRASSTPACRLHAVLQTPRAPVPNISCMSTRNGPHARGHANDDVRSSPAQGADRKTMRYNRAEYAKVLALQDEAARADADYQRLRNAYIDMARREPTHEVGLAMIGADMDRAHARLQALIGLPRLPFTHGPSAVMRREAQRLAGENR